MADDMTSTVTDDSASTATNGAQPGTTLLTDPSVIADDNGGKGEKPPVDSGTGAPAGTEGEKADPANPDGKTTDDPEKPEGVPEKYEISLPDGMAIDEALLAKMEPILREAGLSNEKANKLAAALATARLEDAQAADEAWKNQVAEWATEVRSDKEIGGENFKPSMIAAQQVIAKVGTPELRSLLDASGLGTNPEIVRVFARIGKMMANDTFIKATTPVGEERRGLYAHLPSKS